MVKLKDLVNVNINRDDITIQGVKIPIIFTMEAFPYLEEAYGKGYGAFEAELNRMLEKGITNIGEAEMKIMSALVYSMVRGGGTECTPEELKASIPPLELPVIFEKTMSVFTRQIFQRSDIVKVNNAHTSPKNKKKRRRRK